VVLGGTSNGARDTLMRKLIEEQMPHATAQRTAPPLTEMVGGVMANPIVAINGAPQPITGTPVTPAVAVAPAAGAPTLASTRGGEANPAGGGSTTVSGVNAGQALKADQAFRPSPKTEKPRARAKQAQTQLLEQPQIQAAAPASSVAHAVRQRSSASRTPIER
jgi:hypothetical protein